MVKQERDYIKKKKIRYIIYAIFWTLMVGLIFGTGLYLTKTRSNLFTVSACVVAIVAALFITRLISFSRFKDGEETIAHLLEQVTGDYHLYHSAIVLLPKEISYFEHIVVTPLSVYCLTYETRDASKTEVTLINQLVDRGIPAKHIHLGVIKSANQVTQWINRIEKETKSEHSRLEGYSRIISETLM